jgi:hypothetical protein
VIEMTTYEWRGEFGNAEVNALHAEAFGTRVYDESEWNWQRQVEAHSLGWVVARDGARPDASTSTSTSTTT